MEVINCTLNRFPPAIIIQSAGQTICHARQRSPPRSCKTTRAGKSSRRDESSGRNSKVALHHPKRVVRSRRQCLGSECEVEQEVAAQKLYTRKQQQIMNGRHAADVLLIQPKLFSSTFLPSSLVRTTIAGFYDSPFYIKSPQSYMERLHELILLLFTALRRARGFL